MINFWKRNYESISGLALGLLYGLYFTGWVLVSCEESAPVVFYHTFRTNEILDITPLPDEKITEAMRRFQKTGSNVYNSNRDAVEEGSKLYAEVCAICHGIKAVGRMGPSLIDDKLIYEKNRTDKGLFETIYGGSAGLMASGFKGKLSQDQILKIIAYLRNLQGK